ncbi:MAG: 1,4-dihydroxy-2-naphthoate polyprenyltransferase [Chitinophagales bacterium]|nr:1,4-dihydroxy-2-naphthoate polyprenyltransferase [Bacteroidota bacterium]
MANVSAWISAMRLRTLPLALSGTLMGSGLAYAQGQFSPSVAIWALLTTLLLQILSNFANDYGDAQKGVDNAQRIGPRRSVQSGAISAKQMYQAIVTTAVLCFVCGLALIYASFGSEKLLYGLVFLLLGVAAIAAAIKYTMGKNPYGYAGWGDFFVFIFFGIVAVAGTFYLHTHSFQPDILLPATSIGAFSVAVLNLNNMRDREQDAQHGKNTLAVKLGATGAKYYHAFLLALGFWASAMYMFQHFHSPGQFLFVLLLPFWASQLYKVFVIRQPALLNPLLKQQALSTFFFTLCFLAGLLFAC